VPDHGVRVLVTGAVAESLDFTDSLDAHLPWVFLVVLGSAFILLAAAFRSLVVPVVAVGLNLLSVGAAYGFLVWGFQQKHLDGVIDVAGDGVVVSWMPLFLFVLLFGLSMDYHVFLLSRIRERVLAGYSTRDAIVAGITGSASTITSAALIMVCVFAAFSTSRLAEMQQMGAGLAFAVFVDATVVRALLLPAVMSLLGRANWYLPRGLRWLPGVRLERPGATGRTEAEEPVTA
jgi:RND superfamily putative drug exporter